MPFQKSTVVQYRGWKCPWQASRVQTAFLVYVSISSPICIPLSIPRVESMSGQAVVWPGKRKKESFFFLPKEQRSYRAGETAQTSRNVDLALWSSFPVPQTDLVLISVLFARYRLTKPSAPIARVNQAVIQGRQTLPGCSWRYQLWARSGYFPVCH